MEVLRNVRARLCTDPDMLGEFEWPGFTDPRTQRRRWGEDGYISAGVSAVAVVRGDGIVVGLVSWTPTGFLPAWPTRSGWV